VNQNAFSDGFIEYHTSLKPLSDARSLLQSGDWKDGYAAFSNAEIALDKISAAQISDAMEGRVQGIQGVEGYLVETDLWWHTNEYFEEISIEREDNGFYCQHWKLHQKPENANCYYRSVETLPRNNSTVFKDTPLQSVEVIWPERRLHFFITIGEEVKT